MFAVLQKTYEMMDAKAASDAYVSALGITRIDAMQMVRNRPAGIIADRLEQDQANGLSAALSQIDIDCVVVPMSNYVEIPKAYQIRKAHAAAGGLAWDDLYGREKITAWQDIQQICAGIVLETETTQGPKSGGKSSAAGAVGRIAMGSLVAGPIGAGLGAISAMRQANKDLNKREEQTSVRELITLDIYAEDLTKRLRVIADQFDYTDLGDARTDSYLDNFEALTKGIVYALARPDDIDDGTALVADGKTDDVRVFEDRFVWDAYNKWRLLRQQS